MPRLADHLVVDALGFLLELLVDGDIGVEELVSSLGELASVGAVSVEQLDAQLHFRVLDDAPSLAVSHAHALRCCVKRAVFAHAEAKVGDAPAEHGTLFGIAAFDGEPDDGVE